MSNEMKVPGRRSSSNQSTTQNKTYAALVAAGVLALATSPAGAQSTSTITSVNLTSPVLTLPAPCSVTMAETRLTEWDINPIDDIVPGALVVDDRSNSRHSKVWFVTRNGETRLYRFTPGLGFKRDKAEATSWPLGAIQTGGVRLRHSSDGRFAFVNTNRGGGLAGLVAVDTSNNTRITWIDRPEQVHMSDVSVDTRGGGYSVFTAAEAYQDASGGVVGMNGVVQRLRPLEPRQTLDGKWVVPAEVTRWPVGGGAGTCEDTGIGSPCIPGIVVDRRSGHPVFFSEPAFVASNAPAGTLPGPAIGELDPRPVKCPDNPFSMCARVRHWPLPPGTASPRQILLDDNGRLWGITSSGHLFSLDVDRSHNKGTVTMHDPLGPAIEDLFAVAPDGGTVGFTDSENNEVSVLFPQRVARAVTPAVTFVKPVTQRIDGGREAAAPKTHLVDPRVATAPAVIYTKEGDGTYAETDVSVNTSASDSTSASSLNPTGMSPDGARRTGSFFYGVTFSGGTNRIGHLEVPIDPKKETEHRKDDDDFDDDGEDDDRDADDDNDGRGDEVDDDDDNDCTPDAMDDDHDNDGVENQHDSKSHRENKRTDRGTLAPGEARSYDMESDANSLLMIAAVEAAHLTTPLSIEVVDPNGMVVLATPPALGKAFTTATPLLPGLYTVRVRNTGLTSTTYKTTLIGKQIWF